MKTRTKKGTSSQQPDKSEQPTSKVQQLPPSDTNPPKVFILPKDTSSNARIVTLPNPATSAPTRYFVCPEKGFYEFTRIAGPKRDCRSWLLAPEDVGEDGEGYVLQSPEMMVATPVDPLFILLPALAQSEEDAGGMQMFLSTSDYVSRLEEQSDHLKQVLRDDQRSGNRLEKLFETRMECVCDELEAGDEKLYKLSEKKLLDVLRETARRMVHNGLPASMEEHFVKQALAAPMLSVRREETGMSFTSEAENTNTSASQSEIESASTSQQTQNSSFSIATESTAATSIPPTPSEDNSVATPEIKHLLRLRTAFNFLLASYIPSALRQTLQAALSDTSKAAIDFAPLDAHLAQLEKLKKEAQALRSLSENISRKRALEDDEEAMEKAEARKKKKEEEEFKKKNTSRGVQQLKKADTSGMKKLSSFFTKGAAKK
jgi:hypothetical protein